MQLQRMAPLQLMLAHPHARPIYLHAIGMGIQDAQVEDAHHISVYRHHVQQLQQRDQVKPVGNYPQ